MTLTPQLDSNSSTPIYMQLYAYIKSEIINGNILVDEPIPSIRNLATHLGVSRTTVENAYQQLLAEGYICSKPQKGYYVNRLEEEIFTELLKEKEIIVSHKQSVETYKYDFKSEYVEAHNFNLDNWKKHLNHVINYEKEELFTYGDLQGEETLIVQIVRYIHRTRGVNAKESNVVIGAGVQPLLNILSIILLKEGINKIAIEDPGFNRARNIFMDNNIEIVPLEVSEKGIKITQLNKSCARSCYVSPSHQFPTGTVMLIDTRTQLIKWAYEKKGYIIEDDYNSELRYEGKPIPAMQGLDPHDRVIYLGSFSTVLVPAIRISFMVLPDALMNIYNKEKDKYSQTASKLEQRALAHMMKVGDFDKHIRRIKVNYAKKSEYTMQCIEKHLGDLVDIISVNSGLNILLKLKANCEEIKIINALKASGINISAISEYRMEKDKKSALIFVLSFRGIPTELILEGILRMKEILIYCLYGIENSLKL